MERAVAPRAREIADGRSQGDVLITGGAGFVGSNLADRLLRSGRRVRILDNLSRSGVSSNLSWLQQAHGPRVDIHRGDIRDPQTVRRAVHGVTEVYHLAAQVAVTDSLADPRTDFEVNAVGTFNVLEAVRECDDPPSLLFTSTNKVYGDLSDITLAARKGRYEPVNAAIRQRGVAECRQIDFRSPYGCSKGAADQYVLDYSRSFGLRAVVLRMSCVYGPRQFGTEDQGWVAHFLIRALRGEKIVIYGDGRQVRDALYVGDLVEAMLLAQRDGGRFAGEAFNIGGGPGRTTSLLELVELIGSTTGMRPRLEFAPWRIGDQRYYVSDISRFREATGWGPRVALPEGIGRLHEWIRTAGLDARPTANGAAAAAHQPGHRRGDDSGAFPLTLVEGASRALRLGQGAA